MGLLSWLFGSENEKTQRGSPSEGCDCFAHPALGSFYPEGDGDWLNEHASVPGFGQDISLHLYGDDAGPSKEALKAFDWIVEDPSRVWSRIQDELFEQYETYIEHHPSGVVCSSPEDIPGTAIVVALSLASEEDFEISMTFRWQHPKDDHLITAYVEDGESQGYSVDG